MSDYNIILAGFGGQGVLFAGKILAYSGLLDNKEISWLPSYGPEMRGGTANCSVCISEDQIGSPLVSTPNIFIAMNAPSFEKFINTVEPNGLVIADSSLIDSKVSRDDIKIIYIPSSKIAEDNNLKGLTNLVLLGKLYKEVKFCSEEAINNAIEKCIPKSKSHMLELNKKAFKLGYDA